VLLIFTAGGMVFHQLSGPWVGHLARIGLPFLIGYFVVAHLLRAMQWDPSGTLFMGRSALAWLLGIGVGVTLRISVEGRAPIASFVVVTYLFNGLLLLGWRLIGWWWWTARRSPSPETP
jgi:uncharacterized membrane protein AbrB (regulator of aidB expression)